MKKILALIAVLSFALVVFAAEKGPETIDLSKAFNVEKTTKKPVAFPHAFHQTKNECTECHMSAEGGKALKNINTGAQLEVGTVKGTSNNVHKEFCWACHKAKKVKSGTSCNKCHK
ncbi:cytochrome c3 family protein [Deferribacteraceae bacterium V6Fe1]|nr:cytochrome c3 family protein [Deferribacteraceae bacterium V6Fe1]